MIDGQLELNLARNRGCRLLSRRQRRLHRAHWWFQRMRQAVDRAADWPPAPLPLPAPTTAAGAGRLAPPAASLAPLNPLEKATSEERQTAE